MSTSATDHRSVDDQFLNLHSSSSTSASSFRPHECQYISFDFDDDFDYKLAKDKTITPYITNESSCQTTDSTDLTSSGTSSYSTSTSLTSASSYSCNHFSNSSSSSSFSSNISSSSTESPKESLNSGGKSKKTTIRPTLQCIRNTLALNLAETMKRYDRLSSSKSDLHLSSSSSPHESSVDEIEALEDKLGKSHISSRSSADIVHLDSRKSTILESYSSTENIIPPSSSSGPSEDQHLPEGQLWEGGDSSSGGSSTQGNLPSSAPLTLPSTNTFRSFIKTKTSSGISGIGIMRTKDGLHHAKMEEDEEALQLCDSESTSSIPSVQNQMYPTSVVNPVALVTNASAISLSQPPLPPPHQTTFLANPCHSTVSCACSNSSPQTTLTSIDSTSSKQLAQFAYQQQQQQQQKLNQNRSSEYYKGAPVVQGTPPLPVQTKSRHLRSALIPPILKSKHFVKHNKGNLLFNVKSGHKSKSKQRLTEVGSKEQLSPSRHSEMIVESLKSDRMVLTQPEEDRRRRTIIIEKANNSFGFTLQTYGIKHCREGEVELITYVDEVAYGGPAFRGGMRPGDVILSINGRDVEKADHRTLVNYIHTCEKTMRLVVLFEDCVRKIELNIKYIKLKKALQQKMAQLEILNQRENQVLLNAALRSRSSQERDENVANNNNPDLGGGILLKKYRCKSLDVSLDDINCNNNNNNNNNTSGYCSLGTGAECDWPGTGQEGGAKEYSTTLPRIKGQLGGGGPSDSEEEEDHEYHGKNEEKRTLHKGKRKTSAGNQPTRIGSAGTVPTSAQSRSKSLPQSVANSMDCLTNEAYEDDEDLIGGGQQGHVKGTTTNLATHDKDFITKL